MATLDRNLKRGLELAGAPTPLEQATVPKEWLVPDAIELQGDRLCWRLTKEARNVLGYEEASARRGPGPGLLERFVALADAPADEIVRYARQWGVLAICEHGVPACHSHDCVPVTLPRSRRVIFWEPLESWRFFSHQAKAILELTAATHNSQIVETAPDILWRQPPRPT